MPWHPSIVLYTVDCDWCLVVAVYRGYISFAAPCGTQHAVSAKIGWRCRAYTEPSRCPSSCSVSLSLSYPTRAFRERKAFNGGTCTYFWNKRHEASTPVTKETAGDIPAHKSRYTHLI